MTQTISEAALLAALKSDMNHVSGLIARVTGYHGGPVTTEYLLTASIAREFIEGHYETKVECLTRTLINGLTMRHLGPRPSAFGSKRTDIAVLYGGLIPIALIEVKVGVRTFRKLKDDLDRITTVVGSLKRGYATKVIGAVVFEVHVDGKRRLNSRAALKRAANKIEQAIRNELTRHAAASPGFSFRMSALQAPNGGIAAADEDNDGHATRCHAIIIRDKRPVPPPPQSFAELKQRSNS